MGLPQDYEGQACSLARSLEVVGQRWTLLIVRDAFYGVRRFSDFVEHLQIPRAVLTDRLGSLTAEGVLVRVRSRGGWDDYELTEKGTALWPAIRELLAWGDDHYAPVNGPRRLFHHAADDGLLDRTGRCSRCESTVEAGDIVVVPGPGLEPPAADDDPVTAALARPHRLLQPLHPQTASRRRRSA